MYAARRGPGRARRAQVKEIIYPLGAQIDVRAIRLGDETMSVLEIWGAEYQENDCLLIRPGDRGLLERICARERAIMQARLGHPLHGREPLRCTGILAKTLTDCSSRRRWLDVLSLQRTGARSSGMCCLCPLKQCLSTVREAGVRDRALAACMRCIWLTLWCMGRGSRTHTRTPFSIPARTHAARALTLPCAHAGG